MLQKICNCDGVSAPNLRQNPVLVFIKINIITFFIHSNAFLYVSSFYFNSILRYGFSNILHCVNMAADELIKVTI